MMEHRNEEIEKAIEKAYALVGAKSPVAQDHEDGQEHKNLERPAPALTTSDNICERMRAFQRWWRKRRPKRPAAAAVPFRWLLCRRCHMLFRSWVDEFPEPIWCPRCTRKPEDELEPFDE
jgi:hypothetical protein